MNDQKITLNGNNNTVNQNTILSQKNHLHDLNINFDLLERIINTIFNNLSNCVNKEDIDRDFTRDIDKKNEINKLSDDTYEQCISENIEDFSRIRSFLSDPLNIDTKKKYLAIKNTLYPTVISAIDNGQTMDNVLSELNHKFSKYFVNKATANDDSFINCSGFFYFMYYICDLGKRPHK